MSATTLLVAAAVLLVAAVIVLVVAVLVLLARSRARSAPGARPGSAGPFRRGDTGPFRQADADPFRQADADQDALRGDPRALKPGDLVEIRAHTYAVRGTLRFAEGGWEWAEHFLDDAHGDKVWLSVEEDPDLELALWREVRGATVTPGPKTLEFDGRRFTSDESGRASFTGAGTTGLRERGTVRYHDYESHDGALLSFERYGDSEAWEVGRGDRLHRHEVRIFPRAEDLPDLPASPGGDA